MKVKNVYYTFFIFIVLAILCYPIISTYAFENKKSDIYKNAIEYNCSDNIIIILNQNKPIRLE